MSELNVNDEVMVGENEFSKVISFLHRIENIDAEFVRIYYESNQEDQINGYITMTPKHLIMVETSQGFNFIPANSIKTENVLRYYDSKDDSFRYVKVKKVELVKIENSGIYAPLTETGSLVVDNIHVSCFSMVKSHSLAEIVYKAANWLINISGLDKIYSSNEALIDFTEFLLKLVQTLGVSSVFLNI